MEESHFEQSSTTLSDINQSLKLERAIMAARRSKENTRQKLIEQAEAFNTSAPEDHGSISVASPVPDGFDENGNVQYYRG